MAVVEEEKVDDAASQVSLGTGEDPEKTRPSGKHEQPVNLEAEEIKEESIRSGRDDEDDDEDDEDEEHHDPEPEGPEGLNFGFPPDSEAAAATQVRSHSRASSARSRPLVIVPRRERRGLFAQFVLIPEVERPYDYSRRTKWTITTIVALAAAGGPLGSNIFYRMYHRSTHEWPHEEATGAYALLLVGFLLTMLTSRSVGDVGLFPHQ